MNRRHTNAITQNANPDPTKLILHQALEGHIESINGRDIWCVPLIYLDIRDGFEAEPVRFTFTIESWRYRELSFPTEGTLREIAQQSDQTRK